MYSGNTASEADEVHAAHIRSQLRKRQKTLKWVRIHAAFFVACNLWIWLIYFKTMPLLDEFPFPLVITLGWGIILVTNYRSYRYKFFGGAEKRDDLILREIIDYQRAHRWYDLDSSSQLEATEYGRAEEVYDDQTVGMQK